MAPWVGGKRNLAKRIIKRIEAVPHVFYGEPFVGMGGIFLRREHEAEAEAINDLSLDVATLFRILQRHYVAFLDMLRYQITSRAEFDRLARVDPATLTDLERAARFLYLQRTSYGGKVDGRSFGISRTGPARFDITKLVPMLEDVHTRLARVVIECLPYGDFITRYDRPEALFYVDPPYFGCEDYYGPGLFGREDFERLAGVLRRLQGYFILSLNDHAEVRRIFAGFDIEDVEVSYTLQGSHKAARVRELIISNFRFDNSGGLFRVTDAESMTKSN